jgi:hypothetical protein
MELEFSWYIFKNTCMSNIMKIRPLRAEFFNIDGQTDRQKNHDKVNGQFSQF